MTLDSATREELIAIIVSLKRQIQLQEAETNTLKTRLADALYLISKLSVQLKQLQKGKPADPSLHFKSGIKPDGEKDPRPRNQRTVNFARPKDTPDQIISHAFNACPDCGSRLYQGWLKTSRQVIDLPETPAVITEHRVFEHWCFSCGKRVSPQLNLSDTVLGRHRVSLRLMGLIAVLREQCRLPVGVIQKYFEIFHRLHLSRGEIIEILHTVSARARPAYADLLSTIRGSPVVHGDETGWRENGRNGYLWSFSTPKMKYLLYRKSRGRQVVAEVVGKEFAGVLVSDFYASYNVYLGDHQRCLVHLIRDIKKLIEEYPDHQELKTWSDNVVSVYQEALVYPGPDQHQYPSVRAQRQQRAKDQLGFRQRWLDICRPYLIYQTPMTTLCKRITNHAHELFTFIANPQVPPDNNLAERCLRHSVIARKISGGTRSAKGSQTRFILASLFGTWGLQDKNPFEECVKLLQSVSMGQKPAVRTVSED